MRVVPRRHSCTEEIESYKEYKDKMFNDVLNSIELKMRKIKVSSLKQEDKEHLIHKVKEIVNETEANKQLIR